MNTNLPEDAEMDLIFGGGEKDNEHFRGHFKRLIQDCDTKVKALKQDKADLTIKLDEMTSLLEQQNSKAATLEADLKASQAKIDTLEKELKTTGDKMQKQDEAS